MKDFRLAGAIDTPLWNVAGWSGVAFQFPEVRHPPGIGLVFKDFKAGEEIFRAWRSRFGGEADLHDVISVSIITGTHPIHGEGCSVYIGTNLEGVQQQDYSDAKLVLEPNIHISSIFMFYPKPIPRLQIERFTAERRKYNGAYCLVPCYVLQETREAVPEPALLIGKHRISFRNFSDVRPSEPEHAALLA